MGIGEPEREDGRRVQSCTYLDQFLVVPVCVLFFELVTSNFLVAEERWHGLLWCLFVLLASLPLSLGLHFLLCLNLLYRCYTSR